MPAGFRGCAKLPAEVVLGAGALSAKDPDLAKRLVEKLTPRLVTVPRATLDRCIPCTAPWKSSKIHDNHHPGWAAYKSSCVRNVLSKVR